MVHAYIRRVSGLTTGTKSLSTGFISGYNLLEDRPLLRSSIVRLPTIRRFIETQTLVLVLVLG